MSPRTLVRAGVTTGLALAASALAAPPASATVVPIPMRISVQSHGTYFEVCGTGTAASVVNVWQLRVAGARGDGSVINSTILVLQPEMDECIEVSKNNTTLGSFVATLTYTGAGIDVIGAFPGDARWVPGEPDSTGDGGIGTSLGVGPL